MSTRQVRCLVLGQSTIEVQGKKLETESDLVFALALFTLLRAGERLSREEVAAMFWPQLTPEAANHSLRQLAYRLRTLRIPLQSTDGYLYVDPADVEHDFAELLVDKPQRSRYLQVESFEILPGYAPHLSTRYGRWLDEFREELGARLRAGLVSCIVDARARGRYREVAQLARHCLRLDALNEEATLALAEVAILDGNKVEALRMLEHFQAELGDSAPELKLQSSLLRRRIAERHNVYNAVDTPGEMIGRDAELEYLLRTMHEVRAGHARRVLVTGEPGIGKTRLATEFAKIAVLHGFEVVTLRCQPGGDGQPLLALTELVSAMLQLPGALGCAPEAMATLKELTTTVRPARASALVAAGDGEAMLANLRWSVLDLFDSIVGEQPVLLIVDNLQWLDDLTEEVLDHIARRSAAKRLFILLTSRSHSILVASANTAGRLGSTENVLSLRPLTNESAFRIAQEIADEVGRAIGLDEIERCVQRSGGNPFFLAELTRFHLVGGVDESVPVSLRTFLEFRLSALSHRQQRVLEACAVLGSHATLPRIQCVLHLSSRRLLNLIDDLDRGGFVSATAERCVCRHDVIREVVSDRLTLLSRRVLHLRAARLLHQDARRDNDTLLLYECGRLLIDSGDIQRGMRWALLLAARLLRLGAARRAYELATKSARSAISEKVQNKAFAIRVRALGAAGDWSTMTAVLGERESSSTAREAERGSHDEVELLAIEHRWKTLLKDDPLYATLASCVKQEHASVTHRLRAAHLGMAIAENTRDRALAECILGAIDRVPSTDSRSRALKHAVQMIFNVGFGSAELARRAVDALVSELQNEHFLPHRARLLRHAVNGYSRLGDSDRAYEIGAQGLNLARQLELTQTQFDCLVHMTCADLQSGNDLRALESFSTLRTVAATLSAGSTGVRITLATIGAYVAITTGNTGLLRDIDPGVAASSLESHLLRLREGLLCYEALVAAERNRKATARRACEELARSYSRTRGMGAQDFVVAILAHCYVVTNDEGKAADILRDYLERVRPETQSPAVCVARAALRVHVTITSHARPRQIEEP